MRLNVTGGRAFGAAASSGLLLAAARPPLDWGPLALVAPVSLLLVWRDCRPRRAAALGFTAGVAYHAGLLYWTWWFGAVAIVPLVAFLSLYWAVVGAAVAAFGRARMRSPWLTAAVWVLGEAAIARWPVGGFSWGEVGYAWHDIAPARTLASVGGVPLLSYLTIAAAGLLADAIASYEPGRKRAAGGTRPGRWHRAEIRSGATTAAVAVAVTVAAVLAPSTRDTESIRFALVQGNDLNRYLTDQELEERYLPESHFKLAATLEGAYDLIVLPESSLDEDPRVDPYLAASIADIAGRHDATVMVNATTDADDGRAVNLNLVYGPDGELVGTYSKRHLVPFGEWVPLRSRLGFIDELQQIPRDYVPGESAGIFDVAGLRVATVICFESAFGHEIRSVARRADLVVLSTNNRSYRRSANSAQHVALGQMRAAETGRPVLHAAISGITAVIEADGDVHSTTSLFERAVVTGSVRGRTGETLYLRFGEWVAQACLLAVAWSALLVLARSRRRSVEWAAAPGPLPSPDEPPGSRGSDPTSELP